MSRKARLLLTILWVAGLLAGFSSGQLYRIAHPKQITDASQLVLTVGQADTTIKRTQKRAPALLIHNSTSRRSMLIYISLIQLA